MGVENEGWRVIGITSEALTALASADFRKDRCRKSFVADTWSIA
jgi:hypothetical protein